MLLLAAVLLGGAGPAPDRPPLVPTKDAIIGYHLAPGMGEAIDVRVLVQAGGRALRLDLPDQSFLVARPPSRSLMMVVPQEQTVLELPWDEGPQPLFLLDGRMRFTQRGEATVAGQRCIQWEAILERSRNTVCVTVDGFVLRNISQDQAGRRNRVEAFAIKYQPVAEADFIVPLEYERVVPGHESPPK